MSDTRFTASNGWYIEEDGRLFDDCDNLQCREGPIETSYTEYGAHKAQAERDAALGRWRSVEHPDWIVYPHEREDHVDLLNERNRHRLTIPRSVFYHVEDEDEAYAVAAEYWAAHPVPEPKPWEQAQEGDVWLITRQGVQYPAIFQAEMFGDAGGRWEPDEIDDARRLWPEVSA